MTDVHHDPHHETTHHEESDVDIRGLFGFAAGLTIVLIFVGFLVWVYFQFLAVRANRAVTPEFPLATTRENQLPPEPRLQTNPRQDLRDLRTQEDQTLDSYGWIDKNAGVVHIPIEQAMKLTLQRGLPSRQAKQ